MLLISKVSELCLKLTHPCQVPFGQILQTCNFSLLVLNRGAMAQDAKKSLQLGMKIQKLMYEEL